MKALESKRWQLLRQFPNVDATAAAAGEDVEIDGGRAR